MTGTTITKKYFSLFSFMAAESFSLIFFFSSFTEDKSGWNLASMFLFNSTLLFLLLVCMLSEGFDLTWHRFGWIERVGLRGRGTCQKHMNN